MDQEVETLDLSAILESIDNKDLALEAIVDLSNIEDWHWINPSKA